MRVRKEHEWYRRPFFILPVHLLSENLVITNKYQCFSGGVTSMSVSHIDKFLFIQQCLIYLYGADILSRYVQVRNQLVFRLKPVRSFQRELTRNGCTFFLCVLYVNDPIPKIKVSHYNRKNTFTYLDLYKGSMCCLFIKIFAYSSEIFLTFTQHSYTINAIAVTT